MQYKYTLDNRKGHKKLPCPSCGIKQKFTPYIDIETDTFIDVDSCGICDRSSSCGYHLAPKEYFERNPFAKEQFNYDKPFKPSMPKPKPLPSFHDVELVHKSNKLVHKTNLYKSLLNYFDKESIERVLNLYKVGLSKKWNGANVFWQIDPLGNVRGGKIMLIDANTHKRVKKPYPHATWVHAQLLKKGVINDFNLSQCLFGAHLINTDLNKTIAIVESEKTAITAAIKFPQFIWVATGSMHQLKYEILKDCQNRNLLICPDLGFLDKWKSMMGKNMETLNIQVSFFDQLEILATANDISEGYDIENYILKSIVNTLF